MPALHLVQSFCVCCASGFTTQSTLQNPKGKTFKDQVFIFSLLSQFHFLESYEIWFEKTFFILHVLFSLCFPFSWSLYRKKWKQKTIKLFFVFIVSNTDFLKSGNKVYRKEIFQDNQSLDSCFVLHRSQFWDVKKVWHLICFLSIVWDLYFFLLLCLLL